MRNCFGNLAKFIVVATNLIVFIVGCVSTGFGTYYLVTIDPIETDVSKDSKDVVNYYNSSDNQRQHLIVATSFSAVVAVVSLFGCIGAWKVY